MSDKISEKIWDEIWNWFDKMYPSICMRSQLLKLKSKLENNDMYITNISTNILEKTFVLTVLKKKRVYTVNGVFDEVGVKPSDAKTVFEVNILTEKGKKPSANTVSDIIVWWNVMWLDMNTIGRMCGVQAKLESDGAEFYVLTDERKEFLINRRREALNKPNLMLDCTTLPIDITKTKKESKEVQKTEAISSLLIGEKDTFKFVLIQGDTKIKREIQIPSELKKKDKQAIINSICDNLAWYVAEKTHRAKKLKMSYFKSNQPLEVVLTYEDKLILSTSDMHTESIKEAKELGLNRTETNEFAIKIGSLKDKKGILKFGSKMKCMCQEFADEFKFIFNEDETQDDFQSMIESNSK